MTSHQAPGNTFHYKKNRNPPKIRANDQIQIAPYALKANLDLNDIKKFQIPLQEFVDMVSALKWVAVDMLAKKIYNWAQDYPEIPSITQKQITDVKNREDLYNIINMVQQHVIHGDKAWVLNSACSALMCLFDLCQGRGVLEGFSDLAEFGLFGLLYIEAFFAEKGNYTPILPGCAFDVLTTCRLLRDSPHLMDRFEHHYSTRWNENSAAKFTKHLNAFMEVLQWSVDNYVPLAVNTRSSRPLGYNMLYMDSLLLV